MEAGDVPTGQATPSQAAQGRDQLSIYRGDFPSLPPPPTMKTVIQCIRLDFFNSNTKCLEQIDFAAPVFIMQEELSLIR